MKCFTHPRQYPRCIKALELIAGVLCLTLSCHRGSVVVRHAESSCHRALDTQHLPEGVFVSVLDLEIVPVLPEGLVLARVAQVGRVHIDGTGTVDLSELALQLGIPTETRRSMSGV